MVASAAVRLGWLGNTSAGLRSVADSRRTFKYACGSLGHAFPKLRQLYVFRDEVVMTGKTGRAAMRGYGGNNGGS